MEVRIIENMFDPVKRIHRRLRPSRTQAWYLRVSAGHTGEQRSQPCISGCAGVLFATPLVQRSMLTPATTRLTLCVFRKVDNAVYGIRSHELNYLSSADELYTLTRTAGITQGGPRPCVVDSTVFGAVRRGVSRYLT